MLPSIHTNIAATNASYNLAKANAEQERNLAKLTSGSRLNETSDDAAGAAAHMSMGSAMRRQGVIRANVLNAVSFVHAQGAILNVIREQLTRMSELVVRMQDVTQNSDDLTAYYAEFHQLRQDMGAAMEEKFNGLDLFFTQGTNTPLTVFVDDGGTHSVNVGRSDFTRNSGWDTLLGGFSNKPYVGYAGVTDSAASLVDENFWGNSSMQIMIEELASMLAENGATDTRLRYALEGLQNQQVNTEQAVSRVADVDVAEETTHLSRSTTLVQSASSALKQANSAGEIVLKLMQ